MTPFEDLLQVIPRPHSRRLLLLLAAGAALRAQAPPPPPQAPPPPSGSAQGPVPPPSSQVPLDKLAKAVEDINSKDYTWSVEANPVLRATVPGQIEVFTLDDIQRSGSRTLGEFLAHEMPGHFQSTDGAGLPATGAQDGARPQDTAVLLDGVRINDPSLPGTDLNSIPLIGIIRVEVLNGTESARYGSSAQGGVVALFSSASQPTKGASLEMSGLGGNNGSNLFRVTPNYGWGGGWLRTGSVAMQQNQATDTTNPYRLTSTFLSVGQNFGPVLLSLSYRNTYQGIPDPYEVATEIQRVYDPSREQSYRSTMGQIGMRIALAPGLAADLSLLSGTTTHHAPDPGQADPLAFDGRTLQLSGGVHANWAGFGFSTLVDIGQDKANSPSPIVGDDRARSRHAGLGFEFRYQPFERVRFIANARGGWEGADLTLADGTRQARSQFNTSFRLATHVLLGYGFRLFAGAGRGFNAPLATQMLFNANNGGPQLKEESSNFTFAGLAWGKGWVYSRLEASRSTVDNAIGTNGLIYQNTDHLRFQGVETTLGFKTPFLGIGVEGFVRAQDTRDLNAPPGQEFSNLASSGKPFNTHGLKLLSGKTKWKVDLTYRLVGHRYEWVGDYQCNTLMPNVVNTQVIYRDLSANGSVSVGRHVTILFHGEHLLQPKITAEQWKALIPDPNNDTQRMYGIPAVSPTYSVEVQTRF
ncbi:MAG TPA: TonB-dependent receptor plug domain-containing protein [Holophagaceae bacterium]|nr:TonB-dependent receptor plug domain-containing protein [Holophagaceae bacterium]